jgi:hypothetical protein
LKQGASAATWRHKRTKWLPFVLLLKTGRLTAILD